MTAHVVPEIFSRTDRQTDTHTDILITILRNRSRGRMTFNQHSAYISLPAVTTHAIESQDLRGYRAKRHQICSRSNFFIDGINSTILVAIRPFVVE